MLAPRPCERLCPGCNQWLHHSRFRTWNRRYRSASTITFAERCKACEQKERNEKKNQDRPLAIIENRARVAASKAGKSLEFFWVQMNYRSLVEPLRALFPGSPSVCQACGHQFVNERDIQIDHILPPRNSQDWARLHARNLRLSCGSCNRTKQDKPFDTWLDEQEIARLSNLHSRKEPPESDLQAQIEFEDPFLNESEWASGPSGNQLDLFQK